jgi:hypothetical protein
VISVHNFSVELSESVGGAVRKLPEIGECISGLIMYDNADVYCENRKDYKCNEL